MTARPVRVYDDELDAALAEAERLRGQVTTLLNTHQQISSLLVAADTRVGDFMKLFVTIRAMIESRDANAALASLQDILVNVIGCEQFTIYSIDPRDRMLVPVSGSSAFVRASDGISLDQSWLGDVVRSGVMLVTTKRQPGERRVADVAAVVPLKVLDRVVGAIVIGSLLPHRELLGGRDREILGLLAAYAATAIIAADRRARWRQLPDALR
jgi:GAF domain-containing protein